MYSDVDVYNLEPGYFFAIARASASDFVDATRIMHSSLLSEKSPAVLFADATELISSSARANFFNFANINFSLLFVVAFSEFFDISWDQIKGMD